MEQDIRTLLTAALFAGGDMEIDLTVTDPEFTELFSSFAFGEVLDTCKLELPEALISIMASLVGCQGLDVFRRLVTAVSSGDLKHIGLRPMQLREMLYQATAYVGLGRVLPFLQAFDVAVQEAKIHLPIIKSGTVTAQTRQEAGSKAQIEIFGEGMEGFAESGPEESRHINRWLVSNCFGDYYTRKGLSSSQRELVTFCFLMAQGGCEPQLTAHAAANLRVGNSKEKLIAVLSVCIPFIGYPRALNALRCVETAAEQAAQS